MVILFVYLFLKIGNIQGHHYRALSQVIFDRGILPRILPRILLLLLSGFPDIPLRRRDVGTIICVFISIICAFISITFKLKAHSMYVFYKLKTL